jgi:hypothetical protein
LASLQAVALCESAYASFPDDYRSKQDNNVLVIQNECTTSHVIVCEKLGDFPLECDWSFSRHNQSPLAPPILLGLALHCRCYNNSGSLAIFTAIRLASQHLLPNVAPWLQRHGMSNRPYRLSLLHGVPLLARLVRNEQCPFGQQADCKSSGFLSA